MHMRKYSFLLLVLAGLSACKGHEKKVLVYASDKISVDNTQRHITIANGDGTTHHEQELDFSSGDPVTLDVESPQGKYSVTIPDDGLYIANLKTDTVIGSRQHVGAEGGESHVISQDDLKKRLDSLNQLIVDQNVTEANQNYFIAPHQAVRISTETKSKVFGPFTTIPGGFDAGSVPAIYKFYSMSEMREIIARLQKMSGGSSSDSATSKDGKASKK